MKTDETERASLPASAGSATATWYKASRYSYAVEEVEVVRETEHCIWTAATKYSRERKTNKHGDWGDHYRTGKEALDALRERATKRLAAVEAEAVKLRQVLADMSPNSIVDEAAGEYIKVMQQADTTSETDQTVIFEAEEWEEVKGVIDQMFKDIKYYQDEKP